MRPARSPASSATPPISMRSCRSALFGGMPRMSTRPGTKLSDEDRMLWNLVARTAKPLKGKQAAPTEPALPPLAKPPPATGPTSSRRRPPRRRRPSASMVVACARPADARQAGQGQAADRRPRRPARHDPERGAFAAACPSCSAPMPAAIRYVLVITGKGSRRRRGRPAARGAGLAATPPFRPLVSSHDHAARQHGGAGALYVRLRRHGGHPA